MVQLLGHISVWNLLTETWVILKKISFSCRDIDFRPPYPVERKADQLHFTYLDTLGRPVILIEKSSLVDNHIQDFEVDQQFDEYFLWKLG